MAIAVLFQLNDDVSFIMDRYVKEQIDDLRLCINYDQKLRLVPPKQEDLRRSKLWLILTIIGASLLLIIVVVTVMLICKCRKRRKMANLERGDYHDSSYSTAYYDSHSGIHLG